MAMDKFRNHKRFVLYLAAVTLVVLVTASVTIASGPPQATPAAKVNSDKLNGEYVGNDVCITCHEDQNKRFKNTAMGKAFANPHTPTEKLGCESCHGPGKAHVDAGGGKETILIRFDKDTKT